MCATLEFTFDELNEAKANFDSIYTAADPRAYFRVLGDLDYAIPDRARPIFRRIVEAMRTAGGDRLTALDLGCSYGINAALLKYPLTFEDLRHRYTIPELEALDTETLLTLDRRFYDAWPSDPGLKIIGIDPARSAVTYAERSGALDQGIAVDLEHAQPPDNAVDDLAAVDLVMSTGCVGYVTGRTFEQLAVCAENGTRPWIASFVLRMFPYDEIADALASQGLVTEKLDGATFIQRRFRDDEELQGVLDTLERLGIDPTGKEADGCYHAEFYLSRPKAVARAMPLDTLLAPALVPVMAA